MRWTIYRQELVLFHARHKRLRFIYEEDDNHEPGEIERHKSAESEENKEFVRYRHHAQQILHTLREILKGFPQGTEIYFKDPKVTSGREGRLVINPPSGLKREVVAYINYCEKVLESEGWGEDSAPRQILRTLREESQYDGILHRPTLQCLISTLPILPHWDLPGVFSEDSNNGHTLLGNIRNLQSPVYAAQLMFGRRSGGELTESGGSEQLLGYPVQMKACYADATGDISSTIYVGQDDYYTYCHKPIAAELPLYRPYAVLVDALQEALASTQEATDDRQTSSPNRWNRWLLDRRPKGRRLAKEKRDRWPWKRDKRSEAAASNQHDIFYLAYPIRTSLGRTHFWHFYLTPDLPGATLEQLWASWWPLHQRILDWPYLHASLAAELEQLDIGYAQGAIGKALRKPTEKLVGLGQGDAPLIGRLVCEHGHMLFPASCFCTESADRSKKWGWHYQPYDKAHLPSDGDRDLDVILEVLGELGRLWCEDDPNARPCDKNCTRAESITFRSKHAIGTSFRARLLAQRYRCLVDQQEFLVREMVYAMKERKEHEARVEEEWKAQCRQLFYGLEEGQRIDLWRTIECGSTPRIPVPGEQDLDYAAFIRRYFGTDVTEALARAELIFLVSGDSHAMVSEFLELNPIKMVTHLGPAYLRGWTSASARNRVADFRKMFERLPPQFDTPYRRNLAELADMADKVFGKGQEINVELRDVAACKPKRDDLQIKLVGFIADYADRATVSYEIEGIDPDSSDPRLCLPRNFLAEVFVQALSVSTYRANPTITVFRQASKGDGSEVKRYKNYCLFSWSTGTSFLHNQPEPSKAWLSELRKRLQGIGSCFIGSRHDGHIKFGSVRDDGTLSWDVQSDWLQRATDVGSTKVWQQNNLVLVFESWYFEPKQNGDAP